jgi:hypothetical protein
MSTKALRPKVPKGLIKVEKVCIQDSVKGKSLPPEGS